MYIHIVNQIRKYIYVAEEKRFVYLSFGKSREFIRALRNNQTKHKDGCWHRSTRIGRRPARYYHKATEIPRLTWRIMTSSPIM